MFLSNINRNLKMISRHEDAVLYLSCSFSFSLTIFRIIYSGQLMFAWLNWNLFLALVPFLITSYLVKNIHAIEQNLRFYCWFLLWLFFIPNSFYLVTDLFHLREREPLPLWYDLALIFSFAWNGIILGMYSFFQMEKIVRIKWGKTREWLFITATIFLIAMGVYIGRYLRYNSWDVLTDPFGLTADIIYLFLHPVRNRFDWSMIICYSLLLFIIYQGFRLFRRLKAE